MPMSFVLIVVFWCVRKKKTNNETARFVCVGIRGVFQRLINHRAPVESGQRFPEILSANPSAVLIKKTHNISLAALLIVQHSRHGASKYFIAARLSGQSWS